MNPSQMSVKKLERIIGDYLSEYQGLSEEEIEDRLQEMTREDMENWVLDAQENQD